MKLPTLFLTFFISTICIQSQVVYDVLVLEDFENTTNLRSNGTFINDNQTSGFADAFDVSANYANPEHVTDFITFEEGSVFHAADINGTGGTQPTYLEIFDYLVPHNDHISFVGNFAVSGVSGTLDNTDVLTVQYSTNDGIFWTTGLSLTGDAGQRTMSTDNNTIELNSNLRTKEFGIGDNLSGQIIKIKIVISGFTDPGQAFMLDEFRLVRTREQLTCETFDNTTNLTTSSGSGVFDSPVEDSFHDNNDIYDVTDNMTVPTLITDNIEFNNGSVFVFNHRLGTTVPDNEELVMLNYTPTTNNHISFRGNFAQFGSNTNPDNLVTVQYSINNGVSYTTAFTFKGNIDTPGKYDISDGTEKLQVLKFTTKGFPIGANLLGQTISIKITFSEVDNNDDGIAFDDFCFEASTDPMILPIELIEFNASLKNEVTQLKWSTASEINNSHFEIQKSNDGKSWNTFTILDGAGNSSTIKEYSSVDYSPFENETYYRLKQVDFDGKYEISKVVAIKSISDELNLYPSVIKKGENIFLRNLSNVTNISILDLSGKIIHGYSIQEDAAEFNFSLNIPSGSYFVQTISTNNQKQISRFIIE